MRVLISPLIDKSLEILYNEPVKTRLGDHDAVLKNNILRRILCD